MTTQSRVSRSTKTVYRAVADAVTPIASRSFTDQPWCDNSAQVRGGGDVRKAAGAWIQRLECETGRELQPESTVTIRLETKTVRTVTLTDIISRTESVLQPRSDQYGNQSWKDTNHD